MPLVASYSAKAYTDAKLPISQLTTLICTELVHRLRRYSNSSYIRAAEADAWHG
jgi:hypothetical protein